MNEFLQTYGLAGVTILIGVEYLGIPLPTELAYVVGGSFVKSGKLTYVELFALIMLAHTVGAYVAYSLGLRASKLARISPRMKRLQLKLEKWYLKYGAFTILGTQLIGHIRPWASYVAGFSRVPLPKFLTASLIGSAALTLLMLAVADTLVTLWHAYPMLRVCLVTLFTAFILGAAFVAVKNLFWPEKPSSKSRKRR